jgi:hypothetical protein
MDSNALDRHITGNYGEDQFASNMPDGYLDVWLRLAEDPDDVAEAEANTREDEDGSFYVDWYLNSVGLVKSVRFDTYQEARDWLESEGFEDFTA